MIEVNETGDLAALRAYFDTPTVRPQFTARAIDIPGDMRLAWRLSVLCLLLRRGRANALVLEHLHVLWWAVRSEASRTVLIRWLSGEGRPDELLVRFDPSLTVTLDLALGQRLVSMTATGSAKLTASGLAFVEEIDARKDVLIQEKAFLDALPSRITQRQIQDLLEWK